MRLGEGPPQSKAIEKHPGPFRPRSAEAVNPYIFAEGHEFTEPIIAMDGGILIPGPVIEKLSYSPLGLYLRARTAPITTERFAITHENPFDPDPKINNHSAQPGSWYTSRGNRYYAVNQGFNDGQKSQREELLLANLRMDDDLLTQNWGSVLSSLDELDPESRFRVLTTIYQNIATDLIGLDYMVRIAERYDNTGGSLEAAMFDLHNMVFNSVTAYYSSLLHPEDPYLDPEAFSIVKYAQNVARHLDQTSTVPEGVDNIRNQRESDMTYLTLAAAKSFFAEWPKFSSEGDREPYVIVPLLGAYDLGPALAAIAQEQNSTAPDIYYVVPSEKLLSFFHRPGNVPKRRTNELDIADQVSDIPQTQGRGAVIFEDTLGSGKTLLRMAADLRAKGIPLEGIRTQFLNDSYHPNGSELLGSYEQRYSAYYTLPVTRQDRVDDHQDIIFVRRTSREWLGRRKRLPIPNIGGK